MTKLQLPSVKLCLSLTVFLSPGVCSSSLPPQTSTPSPSTIQRTMVRATVETADVNDWLLDADDTIQMIFYKDKMTCESPVCLNREVISCEYVGQKLNRGFRCFTSYAPHGYALTAVRIKCLERGENEHPDCKLFYSLAALNDYRYEQLAGEIFSFVCMVALCCCILLSMDPVYDRSLYYGFGNPYCGSCGLPPPAAFIPYRLNMNAFKSDSCLFKHVADAGRERPPTSPSVRKALSSKIAHLADAAGFKQHQPNAKPAIGPAEKLPV